MSMDCPDNCLVCNSDQECSRCGYGYNIQAGECQPNSPLPSECISGFNSQQCQLCNQNFTVVPGYYCNQIEYMVECQIEGCLECNNANDCNTCLNGYNLVENGGTMTCEQIECTVDNCQDCPDDVNSCSGCMSGYKLVDSSSCVIKAYPCVENCMYCAEGPNTCGKCNEGYQLEFLYDTDNNQVGSYCQMIPE